MSNTPVIECRRLAKRYLDAEVSAEVLSDVDFSIGKGERYAIIGSSGAGKSTLLQLLGGLDTPSEGQVFINGCEISSLDQTRRGNLRNQALGFIYQFHHLLPEFSALENVCMPLLLRGLSPAQCRDQGHEILDKVGLSHRYHHKPGELSGGERQRAAVARALVTRPDCILADEPTGNLDHKNAGIVYDLMMSLNEAYGTSLVMVTHDARLANQMDKVFRLEDGRLVFLEGGA